MAETTTATWRYALGAHVRWIGAEQGGQITARRWTERPGRAPAVEYEVSALGLLWVMEADLEECATREESADG